MSMKPLPVDMAIAADATLAKVHKKINELVSASNDDFNRIYKINNELVEIRKELKDLKTRVANYG